jgi:hypothetical protein
MSRGEGEAVSVQAEPAVFAALGRSIIGRRPQGGGR